VSSQAVPNRSRRKIAQAALAVSLAEARSREFFAIAVEPLTQISVCR
jgi:hypothetical protein